MTVNREMVSRRTFLKQAIATSIITGVGTISPSLAFGQMCEVQEMPRTLVNFMLQGGADFRYLFMPAPNHHDSNYPDLIWAARRSLYNQEYQSYSEMFDAEYLLARDPISGLEFGISNHAEWLKTQFDEGNVAIVANAHCSRNRRHDQSILNADAGEPDFEFLNFDRDGWGGRLVEHLGGNANSVELGNSVSTFNKGSKRGSRLVQVVHAENMRQLSLPSPELDNPASDRNILARALRAYYDVRGQEVAADKPANWPYHLYFQHNSALRSLGEIIDSRLNSCLPIPEELKQLTLANGDFSQQCRNLYDACQVPGDLKLGTLSMSYGGWDTHNNEAAEIGQNLSDIFGTEGGLKTTMNAIEKLPSADTPAADQLVFYFASDFGRQILANGAAGTDHGRGTYTMALGKQIKGGIYGEMFPERETRPDEFGEVPLKTPGTDIEGLTSTDRILANAVDWVAPGAGDTVFPNAGSSLLEDGVNLAKIFPA